MSFAINKARLCSVKIKSLSGQGHVPSSFAPRVFVGKCIDLLTSSQGSPFLPAMVLEPVGSGALPLPLVQLSYLIFSNIVG